MAETYRYTLVKPARLLYSSITEKSAPRGVMNATAKFSGTFGIEKEDFDAIVQIMVQGITAELGSFSGNPNDISCAYFHAPIFVRSARLAVSKSHTKYFTNHTPSAIAQGRQR